MKLYHGSIVEVRKPSLHYGRERTDFGKGFYTTTQPEQAEHWARIKRDCAKASKAVVSVYNFDDMVLSSPNINFVHPMVWMKGGLILLLIVAKVMLASMISIWYKN